MTDLFAAFPFSREDKIGGLRREVAMRQRVFARRVERGVMERADADREIALMRAILSDYERGDRFADAGMADLCREHAGRADDAGKLARAFLAIGNSDGEGAEQ
jgi:hypothetical protein